MPTPSVSILLSASMIAVLPLAHALSPHAQFESGVPLSEILCPDGKVLLESPRGTPACIRESSSERLLERGFVLVPQVIDVLPPHEESNSNAEVPIQAADELHALDVKRDTDEPPELDDMAPAIVDDLSNVEDDNIEPTIIYLSESPTRADDPKYTDLAEFLPNDVKYDYDLKIPSKDPDEFAQKIAAVANDKIVQIHGLVGQDGVEYITERGKILVRMASQESYAQYFMYGSNRIQHSEEESFVYDMLATLGVEPDESESYITYGDEVSLYPGSRGYGFDQNVNGQFPQAHFISFAFNGDHTYGFIGNWLSDPSQFELISGDEAIKIASEYAVQSKELQGPDCRIKYLPWAVYGFDFKILDGTPVYIVYSGTCLEPYKIFKYGPEWPEGTPDALHCYDYKAYIHAVTGKPHFAIETSSWHGRCGNPS